MIYAKEVSKLFSIGALPFSTLDDINLHIKEGEFVAIMGPSGSGKSTLLQLLGGLDKPSSGEIHMDGISLNDLTEQEKTIFRRRKIGFIFQDYQLLPTLTVEENVAFPLQH